MKRRVLPGSKGRNGNSGGRFDFGGNVVGGQTAATAWMTTGGYAEAGLQGSIRGFVALEAGEVYAASESAAVAGTGTAVVFYEVYVANAATGKGLSVALTATSGTRATFSPTIPYAAGDHVAVKPWRGAGTFGLGRSNCTLSLATRAT